MPHAADGPGGGRILVQAPGPLGRAPARPAGVFGERREQPQLVLVGAGEVLLADVTGVREYGAQLRADTGRRQLVPALTGQRVQKRPAGGARDSIAPTMTWFAVTTAWPLYPAT